jgi:Tol biopolymer transport system component
MTKKANTCFIALMWSIVTLCFSVLAGPSQHTIKNPLGTLKYIQPDERITGKDLKVHNMHISGNGHFIVYDIVEFTVDKPIKSAIVLHDVHTGKQEIINLPEITNGLVTSISFDGRFVTYVQELEFSCNGNSFYVYDKESKKTKKITPIVNGRVLGVVNWPILSYSGKSIVFSSTPTCNPLPTRSQVYLYDQTNETFQLISRSPSGRPGNGVSRATSISSDGRYIAFESTASNLVKSTGDNIGESQVYVNDRILGKIEIVSIGYDGKFGDLGGEGQGSYSASISANGRYVVFNSHSGNLVPNDPNQSADIYLRDRWSHTTERLRVNQGEFSYYTFYPLISGNGRYMLFTDGHEKVLGANDRVYVMDLVTKSTQLISVDQKGKVANSESISKAISHDGSFIVFKSYATNLIPNIKEDWNHFLLKRKRTNHGDFIVP